MKNLYKSLFLILVMPILWGVTPAKAISVKDYAYFTLPPSADLRGGLRYGGPNGPEVITWNFSNSSCAVAATCILVLDCTGSMGGYPIQDLRVAAQEFVNLMSDQDSLGSLVFPLDPGFTFPGGSCPVNFIFPLLQVGPNRALMLQRISQLDASGTTSFYDAIGYVLQYSSTLPGPKQIIAMTDGEDNCSVRYNVPEIISYATQLNATISVVGLGQIGAGQQGMQSIANSTGGLYYYTPNSGQLITIYQTLQRQLFRTFYFGEAENLSRSALPAACTSSDNRCFTVQPQFFQALAGNALNYVDWVDLQQTLTQDFDIQQSLTTSVLRVGVFTNDSIPDLNINVVVLDANNTVIMGPSYFAADNCTGWKWAQVSSLVGDIVLPSGRYRLKMERESQQQLMLAYTHDDLLGTTTLGPNRFPNDVYFLVIDGNPPSHTPTPTSTSTPTSTPTITPTRTATDLPTNTVSPTTTATPIITPTPACTPEPTNTPLQAGKTGLWLNATFAADTLKVDMRVVWARSVPTSPWSLFVAVELAGAFYFYPAFTEFASPLVSGLSLPANFDSGEFELAALPLGASGPSCFLATWYAAFLDETGSLAEPGLASSAVRLWP